MCLKIDAKMPEVDAKVTKIVAKTMSGARTWAFGVRLFQPQPPGQWQSRGRMYDWLCGLWHCNYTRWSLS